MERRNKNGTERNRTECRKSRYFVFAPCASRILCDAVKYIFDRTNVSCVPPISIQLMLTMESDIRINSHWFRPAIISCEFNYERMKLIEFKFKYELTMC